jgi:hypothetical protein
MKVEWVLGAVAALGLSWTLAWGSLRIVPRVRRRMLWLPWIGLGLGSAVLGSTVGLLLTFLTWRLTPGAESCTGCEMGWGIIGLGATLFGGFIGLASGLRAGRSALGGSTGDDRVA